MMTQVTSCRPFCRNIYTPLAHHGFPVPSHSLVSAGAVYKQQMERLSGLIEASKAGPYQEQERLWRELQTLVSKGSRDRCTLPQADDLLQDLKSSQVSPPSAMSADVADVTTQAVYMHAKKVQATIQCL